MKRIVSGILFTLFLLNMLTSSLTPSYSNSYINVTVSEAKQMIESNPNLVILDVRTQAEYDSGHIQNATLIPVTELANRLGELDKDREILVYCKAGGRSATASQILVDNGFLRVYNMLGGITAWTSAGYRIEIIHNGDLIIDGTQTSVIENCIYVQEGNILLTDFAKLIVSNSSIETRGGYAWQFGIEVFDYANLEMRNVNASTGFWIRTHDDARTSINNSKVDWLACFGDSVVEIRNSTIDGIGMRQSSSLTIESSHLGGAEFAVDPENVISLTNMTPGLYSHWDLHENQALCNVLYDLTLIDTHVEGWGVYVSIQSTVTIANSTLGIGISFSDVAAQIRDVDFRPGFYEMWSYSAITIENCWITFAQMSFNQVSYTVSNSTIHYLEATGKTDISLIQSSLLVADYGNALGTLYSNKSRVTCLNILNSNLFVYGDLEFSADGCVGSWISSNITRSYKFMTEGIDGSPVANAGLTLVGRDGTAVWNGVTDGSGEANFNLTFADSNYTDVLRLEAVRGNLSVAKNITLLSDTPVMIQIGLLSDINGDWAVDIYDAIMLANAYNSKPDDSNWNANADINDDGTIDIYDAIILASNYGKKA